MDIFLMLGDEKDKHPRHNSSNKTVEHIAQNTKLKHVEEKNCEIKHESSKASAI